jgi:hypothetical protein
MRSNFPTSFGIPIFPESDGYLPYGVTDNGDTLFWVTTGAPGEWTMAVMGPREPEVFVFPGGVVEFLADLLCREPARFGDLRISRGGGSGIG